MSPQNDEEEDDGGDENEEQEQEEQQQQQAIQIAVSKCANCDSLVLFSKPDSTPLGGLFFFFVWINS